MLFRSVATRARLTLAIAFVCSAGLLASPSVTAETGSQETGSQEMGSREAGQRAYDISSNLMSPWCPGTLQHCPSPNAGAARDQIRAWIDAGLSDEEILSRVESSFGDRVKPIPKSAWGWGSPVVILVVGLVLLGFAISRTIRARGQEEAEIDPAIASELEAALREEIPED